MTAAQVPTASFEDEDVTSAPAASSVPAQDVPARPNVGSQSTRVDPPTGNGAAAGPGSFPPNVGSQSARVDPPTGNGAAAGPDATNSPSPATTTSSGMAAFEERAFGANTALRPGFARLSLLVAANGSTVFVTPPNDGNAERPLESALVQCSTQCSVDLPLGRYTVWVKTADDARSSRDFELRSSRWLSVAPANQVMRDFGFAAGAVGTAATVLGLAILAEVICESCTSTGRHVTGGLALGLGLPMGAVGWSLYFIHREARIEDRILTQAEGVGVAAPGSQTALSGALLQTRFAF